MSSSSSTALSFASALKDRELPRNPLAMGLVGFNVGVEGGQLAVLTAVFLLSGWPHSAVQWRGWIVIPGSIAIALCGVCWTIQRIVWK